MYWAGVGWIVRWRWRLIDSARCLAADRFQAAEDWRAQSFLNAPAGLASAAFVVTCPTVIITMVVIMGLI